VVEERDMQRRQTLVALFAGLVFGVGLLVSGMTSPTKVEGFLDLAGAWDPSLALVMGGAIGVGLAAFAIARRRQTTLLGTPMRLPDKREIDPRLIVGSTLFGIGWGIAGICPGPGIVALGTGSSGALFFVGAMIAGMGAFELVERARSRQVQTTAEAAE
jgi:hypothetical protein